MKNPRSDKAGALRGRLGSASGRAISHRFTILGTECPAAPAAAGERGTERRESRPPDPADTGAPAAVGQFGPNNPRRLLGAITCPAAYTAAGGEGNREKEKGPPLPGGVLNSANAQKNEMAAHGEKAAG